MVSIVIVQKNGDLKENNVKEFSKNDLYKKCNFKKADNFICRTVWNNKNNLFDFTNIQLWAKDEGKANSENKYDFPPPVDNSLYFGNCALLAFKNDEIIDLSIELWEKYYEYLFGGFENLKDCEEEDENEEDELEHIPNEMKTKEGYLKDGFVIDDDNDSELSFEEYYYSD